MKRGCTQCGECLNVCPIYKQFSREEYAPKGKRLLMEPLDKDFGGDPSKANLDWKQVKELARLCAGCGRCQKACARKLSTADLLAEVRHEHPHWTQQFWELWIGKMGPMWPSLGLMASLVPGWLAPSPLKPLHDTAKALVDKGLVKPWARIYKDPAATVDTTNPVVLFAGCTGNNVRKKWIEKTNNLIKAWGYKMLDPKGFACCGATMHHAGQFEIMHKMENQNIAYWRELGKPRMAVFCGSCFHGLYGYKDSEFNSPEEAKEWRAALQPVSKLLVNAKVDMTSEKPAAYGYHQPCHWIDHDNDMPFLSGLFPGMKKGSALCCGMGGILQMSNPGLSRKMANTCLDAFPDEVKQIVTGCSGCVMQLNAASGESKNKPQIVHWLDVLTL